MFPRDLILLDYETTGTSVLRGHEPIQVGAVRLDRRTLDEVAWFSSFIRPMHPDRAEQSAFEVNGVLLHDLSAAPQPAEVVLGFEAALLHPWEIASPETWVLLAAHNAPFDRAFHE